MGSIWEVLRPAKAGKPESVPLWTSVCLPHCYNAEDGVDPSVNYYQGPAWYRTTLHVANPYPGGHTLLQFEGAGQKTEVYIGTRKMGSHAGGYDRFMVDITAAGEGDLPLSIRCDNSRDVEMIPSDMSDFCLYGGLYRPVYLVYVNGVSAGKKRRNPLDYPAQGFHWNVMMQNCCKIKAPPLAQAAFRQPTALESFDVQPRN